MDNLIPVVIGAGIAGLAGAFGAWLQSRFQHRQWLRERRYEAYTAIDALLTSTEVRGWPARDGDAAAAAVFAKEIDEMTAKDLPPLMARVNLLGPDAVLAAQGRYLEALRHPEDVQTLERESSKFIGAMRRALKIPVFLWWR